MIKTASTPSYLASTTTLSAKASTTLSSSGNFKAVARSDFDTDLFYLVVMFISSNLSLIWVTMGSTTSTTPATSVTAITTTTITAITAATTITEVTAIKDAPVPIQAPIQTVPVRYRPIHTVSDHSSQIQTEFVTNSYFSLVLVCYFRYFDKWMDHLLILISLFCAGWLNCLVLFLTIQTLPLKLNLKTLEKWKYQLLILTRLPCAIVLLCLVLFRTSQTCPFNPTLSICLWYLRMIVVVELSDLWRALKDDGSSLDSISVAIVVILIVSRQTHVNLMNHINE